MTDRNGNVLLPRIIFELKLRGRALHLYMLLCRWPGVLSLRSDIFNQYSKRQLEFAFKELERPLALLGGKSLITRTSGPERVVTVVNIEVENRKFFENPDSKYL